jgi:hypothetical protein
MSEVLSDLNRECRLFLEEKKFLLTPAEDIDLQKASSLICEFMQSKGFRLADSMCIYCHENCEVDKLL